MSIVMLGATSGSVTLQEPAVAGTTVIDLPATSGTMVVTGGAQTVQFAAGSAAAPSITFTGDTNTGIFSPSADAIAFTEGGVESMRIDSSGFVNIGRVGTSGNARLSVAGNSDTNNGINLSYSGVGEGCIRVVSSNALTFGYDGASGSTERMRIDSSGNLLVGLTTSSGRLAVKQVSGNNFGGGFTLMRSDNTNNWQFVNGSDDVLYLGWNSATRGTFNPSTGAYSAVSDKNLKKNIVNISYGLDAIKDLKPVEYNMVGESDDAKKHLGFIAQEAKEVLPSSVSVMMGDILGMDRTEIIPVLVKAIQELNAKVEAQAARIAELEGAK
jgi:hypothetical protein